jgi:homoserine dehydrogenase
MKNTDAITVGLLGLGTVGGAVESAIDRKVDVIAAHVGRPVLVRHVLVRDSDRSRLVHGAQAVVTTDPDQLLSDPTVDIVVELMGGEYPAFDYIQRAIHSGKHVVTANKEVMAKHGSKLMSHAAEHGVILRFEASVGGGIPIISPLMRDLLANEVSGVSGIINGTTNYILTCMALDGVEYKKALAMAKALGYAETDSSSDVHGVDAAYKLAIIASLAFHSTVDPTHIYHEGIDKLASVDFHYARELGFMIKLLAIGKCSEGMVQARVHPAFLPYHHPLAKVEGVFNGILLHGDLLGWVMFHGPGAGGSPTASAVIGDIVDVARVIATGSQQIWPPMVDRNLPIQSIDDLETKYYLRLQAADRPGVMAQITRALGDFEVSLASVIQKGVSSNGTFAEIVITTHLAKESAVQEAVKSLRNLDVVHEVSNLIRIEDHSNQ